MNQKTQDFINMLSKFREWMEAERINISENNFCKKYHISRITLIRYMWEPWAKNLPRWSCRKQLPVNEINELRKHFSDNEVAKKYKTYAEDIVIQCGKRKEIWLPKVYNKWVYNEKIVVKNERSDLKTDKWEYPPDTEYEKQWKQWAIEIGTNPIKTLYSLIK